MKGLKLRLVFGAVFLFLFLMVNYGVQFSSAAGMKCWVRMVPEQPTECDGVKVIVNFLFYTEPPSVIDFGVVRREGNVFSVDVIVYVPRKDELTLQVVHNQSFSYVLGKLEAGEYTFKVYVQTVHGSNDYWLEKEVKFTVSSAIDSADAAPELPNFSYVLILLALTSIVTVLLKVSKRRK